MYRTLANYNIQKAMCQKSTQLTMVLIVLIMGTLFSSCDAVFEDDLAKECIEQNDPPNGAVLGNSNVSFSWDEVDEALSYEFKIADPSFSDPNRIIALDSTLSASGLTHQLYLGDFEWSVQAFNSSSETGIAISSFSVNGEGDITNQSVSIVSPESGVVQAEASVEFEWEEMNGAQDYTIRIYSYENETQGELIEIVSSNETEENVSLSEGVYYWTIQASNGGSQLSQLSSAIFTVDLTAPSFPELSSPNDETFSGSEDILFSWVSGEDLLTSTVDSIFVYSESPDELVFSEEVTSVYTMTAGILAAGNYEWNVTTFDEAGNYASSNSLIFEVNE